MTTKIKHPQINVCFNLESSITKQCQLTNSNQVYDYCLKIWDHGTISLYEEVKAIYLNRDNRVIGYRNIALGTTYQAVVNVKLLVYIALECNACGIVVAHNHPSGNVKPSKPDHNLTEQIKEALKFFNLNLLDHLIITKENYFSFADDGIL